MAHGDYECCACCDSMLVFIQAHGVGHHLASLDLKCVCGAEIHERNKHPLMEQKEPDDAV